MTTREPHFQEVQFLRQSPFSWLVYFVEAVIWYGFVRQIIFQQPFGTNPAPDWMMWLIWLLIGIGLPLLWVVSKLIVEVHDTYLHIRYVPFISRQILFSDIRRVEARTYSPILEYGGWGVRWWFGGKRAYNVKGNRGVELELHNGQTIMIGSQQTDELAQAITRQLG